MTIIKEVVCSKCGKNQKKDLEELLKANLFWRTCEFCHRYGLYRRVRQQMNSLSDWLAALYQSTDLTSFEKSLISDRKE
jgi:hypothetical protein